MPMNLNWAERQIFLKHAWGPGPLLDMFSALGFKAVCAAVKMNLFEILESNGPQTPAGLADLVRADARGIELLLHVLRGQGYVELKRGSRYANTAMTRSWMLARSGVNCSTMFGFFEDAIDRWSKLDDSIRNGHPAENCDAWLNRHPGSWERYHANLHGVARLLFPEVVKRLRLPPAAKRLVDIGGSHGLYSVELCRKHPGLSAVIFDWPQAAPAALKTIRDHGMSDRVSFVEGDFFRDSIGEGYDAALLFNVIRIFPEAEAVALLATTQKALRPGGKVFVADQFNSSTPTSFSETNAFLILLELYNGSPGRNYSADQVKSMALAAGFGRPREILLRRSAGVSVVEAERVY